MCIGSVKLIVAQTKVTLAYKLVGDLCILLTLISFKFDIHVFGILSGNDIQIQIGEDGILSLPSFTQQLDFSSTKTSKRRKTMEEEEILTLRAEREKYLQESEFYKTKTAYIKMKIKLLNSET